MSNGLAIVLYFVLSSAWQSFNYCFYTFNILYNNSKRMWIRYYEHAQLRPWKLSSEFYDLKDVLFPKWKYGFRGHWKLGDIVFQEGLPLFFMTLCDEMGEESKLMKITWHHLWTAPCTQEARSWNSQNYSASVRTQYSTSLDRNAYHNQCHKVNPIPEWMDILHIVHYVHPSSQADHLPQHKQQSQQNMEQASIGWTNQF